MPEPTQDKPKRARRKPKPLPPPKEPVYSFQPGYGWVPKVPRDSNILTLEDVAYGNWATYPDTGYEVPVVCKGWTRLACYYADLKVGDVVVYYGNIKQVTFKGVHVRGVKIGKPYRDGNPAYISKGYRFQVVWYNFVLRAPGDD